jgi:outer membrane receptor protein involved in Fe transport
MMDRIVFLATGFLLVSNLALPQSGQLEGTVEDAQGFVLPGVTVTLTGEAVMGQRLATTDIDGSYRFRALAPATYNLSFKLPGFQTLNRHGIIVTSGNTFTIDATLQLATISESLTVVGNSPVVDVKTTGISSTFDETQLDEIPSATDMWAVLRQTPGIRMRGYDVGGSHKSQQTGYQAFGIRSQNRVITDGINTTEGTGGSGGYFDFYAIEEYQVSAQGADVEMSTPGAQVVATTKSGSNAFSGLYHIDYENEKMVADNIDDDIRARGGTSAPVRLFWEGHADLGGPIVKDKLWFFGAYNHFKIDRVISGQDPAVATDIGLFDMYSAKLNWRISQKDQFIGYSQWAWKRKPYLGLSLSRPAESILAQDSWGWIHKAEWQRLWSDRVFMHVFVGHFGVGFPVVPAIDPTLRPARIDTATGNLRGAGWQPFTFYRYKPQTTGQVAWYLPSAAGSHDLKFGWDWQIDSAQNGWNANSGAIRYRDNSNLGAALPTYTDPAFDPGLPANASTLYNARTDEIDVVNVPTLNDDRNMHTDFYAQDTWTLNDRLTMMLGVRFGRQKLYYLGSSQTPVLTDFFSPTAVDGKTVVTFNNIAPRLGATFDLTGKGRTILKAYYGRYYGNVGSGLSGANPAGQQTLRHKLNDFNGNGIYDGEAELGETIGCFGVCGVEEGTPVVDDTKLMHSDELSFSVERELMADSSFRFSYVRKQTRNNWMFSSLEPLNIARATDNLTRPYTTTCVNCPGSFDGQTLNLRTLPDGVPNNEVVYANAPGDTDGAYDTMQVAYRRRFRAGFLVNAHFDYQWRSEMRNPAFAAQGNLVTDPISVSWGPEYNTAVRLIQDTTYWNIGVTSRYQLGNGIGVAGSWRSNSGFPWAPIHRVSLPRVGTQAFLLEDMKNNRSDNVSQVDLRVDYSLSLAARSRITLMADLYNAFNSNPETNFIIRTGSSYNRIIEWLPGRAFKIGVRFQF